MQQQNYKKVTQYFKTPIDFLRFGIQEAHQHQLWYGHGTNNAVDEMRFLILGALKLPFDSHETSIVQYRLTQHEKIVLTRLLEKRILKRIPVAYLLHEAYFAGLQFYVDHNVFIPRSPLAECIQQHFEPWIKVAEVHHILDLCTGSGAIACVCAKMFPHAQVDAVDISKAALAIAQINIQRHQLKSVQLIHADVWKGCPLKQYDVIISNPPYVSEAEYDTLPKEYQYEPMLALKAPQQGLAVIENILLSAKKYLKKRGILIMEVGSAEAALIAAYPQLPFIWLELKEGGEGVFILNAEDL